MLNAIKTFTIFILLFLLHSILSGQNKIDQNRLIKKGDVYYLSNIIHIKLKDEPQTLQKRVEVNPELKSKLDAYSVKEITRAFMDNSNLLNRIVTVEYDSPEDPLVLSAKLSGLPGVIWAEPHYIYQVDFIPDDPQLSVQWGLEKIQAEAAWDISKGDTSIIIGIVDTGVDWDHPDLRSQIYLNKNEIRSNGIDDDNNGYVDDVRGWDLGGLIDIPDNNPDEDRPDHGTHVAGIASAITGNGVGISSIGFNCKIMPVKVTIGNFRAGNGEPFIAYGFEGIKYAADNGANVINCSWGGSAFSRYGQEIVNYAISKGALIVAAAGNSGAYADHYPSGYDGVLSVTSVNEVDKKSSFSTFGNSVDVSAPGEGIFSTWKDDTYINLEGTSMSSPLVAGLAGLVFSNFPNYTPLQVAEQIRVNTDDIDNNNTAYVNRIGKGRINAFKTLNNVNSKSVRAIEFTFSDNTSGGNNNGLLSSGELINVSVKFMNNLSGIENLTVTLESKDVYAEVVKSSFVSGTVATLDSFNNTSDPFQFRISKNAPDNEELSFMLKYTSGDYSDYQWITIPVNPTYKTQDISEVDLTLTSKGALGFNDYPDNQSGQGFTFRNSINLLFEGAFMFGNSANAVSDAARLGGNRDQSTDFITISPVIISTPGDIADQQGFTSFSDSGAPANSMFNIITSQYSYSFTDEEYNDFIILRYKMHNNSSDRISNLYAGLFFDFDIIEEEARGNRVSFSSDYNFGYTYHNSALGNIYIGCTLLTHSNFNFYAIENPGDEGIEIYNDFSDAEKFLVLSNGTNKTQAGPEDVSMTASGGPYNLEPGDTLDIAFSVAAAVNFDEMLKAIQASRKKYSSIDTTVDVPMIPLEYKLYTNYPNPFNSSTMIRYSIPEKSFVTLKVYDILGAEVMTLVEGEKEPSELHSVKFNPKNLASGVYFYRLNAGNFSSVKKMMYLK